MIKIRSDKRWRKTAREAKHGPVGAAADDSGSENQDGRGLFSVLNAPSLWRQSGEELPLPAAHGAKFQQATASPGEMAMLGDGRHEESKAVATDGVFNVGLCADYQRCKFFYNTYTCVS